VNPVGPHHDADFTPIASSTLMSVGACIDMISQLGTGTFVQIFRVWIRENAARSVNWQRMSSQQHRN
jgi:hypothetical protein